MTQQEFLLDLLQYYTENTDRRCANENDICSYSPITAGKENISDGCAIGRHLHPKVKEEFDRKQSGQSIKGIMLDSYYRKKLPQWMQVMDVDFLASCQILHDLSNNWGENSLSDYGRGSLETLLNTYDLEKEPFAKYLN